MAEFSNPNLPGQGGNSGGSGGNDMRGMLSITLVGLVLLLGFQFFTKSKQPPVPPPVQSQSQAQSQPQPMNQASPQAAGAPQAQLVSPQVATPAIVAASATETTVENAYYKIVFTNQGAQVKHWFLKKYNDSTGKPLDMVQTDVAARFGLPLSLYTYEPELTNQLNSALYQLSGDASAAGVLQAPGAITFHYATNGIDVVKTFRFDQSYVVTAEAQVKRNGSPVRALLAWPAGLGDMEELANLSRRSGILPGGRTPSQFSWSQDGKDDSVVASKVAGNATLDHSYEYAAISDLYFAAAFLPDAPERTTVVTLHNSIDLPSNLSDPNSPKKPVDVIGLAVGDTSGYTRVRLFAGPKETDLLKTIHSSGPDAKPTGPTLESLIQYGWMTVIAKPLYLALRGLRGWLGAGDYNWGWAILLFTAAFNLIMLPTRYMMLKSSLKMLRIQPKVDAIKNRFKHLKPTDPKRSDMNAEMMALYKTEGVNMYGSCLPMLIQMPLFFAYYRVLLYAVELRQAHWFWINDLSIADPHYVLPGIIIVTMFVTQYVTPSPGMDPAQRKMMAFMMPVMMGFMFANLASGLALYMATGGVINMAIQLGINQTSIGKEMHEIAAKRAAKKSGASTISGQIQRRK